MVGDAVTDYIKDKLFAGVSVYDVKTGGHAFEVMGGHADTGLVLSRRFCVARFVFGSESGWPMKELRVTDGWDGRKRRWLGADDSKAVAIFGSVDDAIAAIKMNGGPPARCEDLVVPLPSMTWRVLLHSHYDGSIHLAYRGTDYDVALTAFDRVARMASKADGANYLNPVLEGVVIRADLGAAELPAKDNLLEAH